MEMEITMSRKKRKAQAAEVPDIEASGKDMYDWVQCLIVALIICVVFCVLCAHYRRRWHVDEPDAQ